MLLTLILAAVAAQKVSISGLHSLLLKAEKAGITSREIEVFPIENGLSLISYADEKSWRRREPTFRCELSLDDLLRSPDGDLKLQQHRALLTSYKYLAERQFLFERGLIAHLNNISNKYSLVIITARPPGRNSFSLQLDKGGSVSRLSVRRGPPGSVD